MTRSDIWRSQPDSTGEAANVNYAGAHHHNFGEEHHHKPTKAIVGVSALILLSFLLYEINGKTPTVHLSATTNQTVASSNR